MTTVRLTRPRAGSATGPALPRRRGPRATQITRTAAAPMAEPANALLGCWRPAARGADFTLSIR